MPLRMMSQTKSPFLDAEHCLQDAMHYWGRCAVALLCSNVTTISRNLLCHCRCVAIQGIFCTRKRNRRCVTSSVERGTLVAMLVIVTSKTRNSIMIEDNVGYNCMVEIKGERERDGKRCMKYTTLYTVSLSPSKYYSSCIYS